MPLNSLRDRIKGHNLSPTFGTITEINANMVLAKGLKVSIGDTVRMISEDGQMNTMGMVTEIREGGFAISPFSFIEGYCVGDEVFLEQNGMKIDIGPELLGRVVDPFMNPIDGQGPLRCSAQSPIIKQPIAAMSRGMIDEKFSGACF